MPRRESRLGGSAGLARRGSITVGVHLPNGCNRGREQRWADGQCREVPGSRCGIIGLIAAQVRRTGTRRTSCAAPRSFRRRG